MPTTPTQATRPGLRPYRLTVRQFETMIAAGVFPDGARVELLGGRLIEGMTKNSPHNFAIFQLGDALRGILPTGWYVREEKSIVLGRYWRPEPDLAVIRGPRERYRSGDPRPADLALLIEVSDESYAKDRGVKWRRYAASRVPVYWIVNLPDRRVEVYANPAGRGRSASYRDATTFAEADAVPVVIEGREVGRVAVRDLLP